MTSRLTSPRKVLPPANWPTRSYADLYGTTTRDGQRVSKLASYTGRGSLEGWLRTVMAQEFVNRFRRQRRLVSLDEESEDGAQFAATDPEPAAAVDPRVEAATDEVLSDVAGRGSIHSGILLFGRPHSG